METHWKPSMKKTTSFSIILTKLNSRCSHQRTTEQIGEDREHWTRIGGKCSRFCSRSSFAVGCNQQQTDKLGKVEGHKKIELR